MSSEITRNYAAEAVAIATGQSRLLPEPEHLQALAAQMESVLTEKRLLIEILAAAMVDTGQAQLYFPAEDLARVRTLGLNVTIEKDPRNMPGAVIVALSKRPAAVPAQKARVN